MKLTQRLLNYLYRAFDKDPDAFTAVRLSSAAGVLSWAVSDRVLTVMIDGETDLVTSLSGKSIADLVAELSARYVVQDVISDGRASLSAATLIDGAGSVSDLNGDRLQAYQSLTWIFLDACAGELKALSESAEAAPAQLATVTAEADWLDEIGSYYSVPRLVGEGDAAYGPRIIAEVIAPKSNNVALEIAIKRAFGQPATVKDVREWGPAFPLLNGAVDLDGTYLLNATATPLYGLFDVTVGYDFEFGPSIDLLLAQMKEFVGRLRAAGAHLRALDFVSGDVTDAVPEVSDPDLIALGATVELTDDPAAPADDLSALAIAMSALEDLVAPGADEASLTLSYSISLNGSRKLSGGFPLASGSPISEAF